jgi:hypothetical protein
VPNSAARLFKETYYPLIVAELAAIADGGEISLGRLGGVLSETDIER